LEVDVQTSGDERGGSSSESSGATAVPATEAAPTVAPEKRAAAPSANEGRELEAAVRTGDEDRWLAAQFAPKPIVKKLIALYAFNLEVARIAERIKEPRLGEIRLQWWREAVEEIFRGGPVADHPVVHALAELVREDKLPLELFDALLTARVSDLNAAPFETWADLDAYVDATAGGIIRLASQICAPDLAFTPQRLNAIQLAGRGWGLSGMMRALPAWQARGRSFFPANLRSNLRLDSDETGEPSQAFAAHAILDRAAGSQKQLDRYSRALPKEMFPAIGYAALTPLYLKVQFGKELGRNFDEPGQFSRKFKLVMASATGKF
jgi:phytoene synthase